MNGLYNKAIQRFLKSPSRVWIDGWMHGLVDGGWMDG
jgi:hypothetical protein